LDHFAELFDFWFSLLERDIHGTSCLKNLLSNEASMLVDVSDKTECVNLECHLLHNFGVSSVRHKVTSEYEMFIVGFMFSRVIVNL